MPPFPFPKDFFPPGKDMEMGCIDKTADLWIGDGGDIGGQGKQRGK